MKITADTVEQFLEKGGKKFGKGRMGSFTPKPGYSLGGFSDGMITKLEFTFEGTADYAEDGGGKRDEANKRAIKLVAELAKEHEGRHESYCKDAFRTWKPDDKADALIRLRFGSKGEAVKAIEAKLGELKAALHDACLDVHRRDGLIGVELKKDGSFDVFTKPEGAKGCK